MEPPACIHTAGRHGKIPWYHLTSPQGRHPPSRGVPTEHHAITADGTLDLSETDRYFTPRTRLVSLTYQSNVFGTVNPVRKLLALARQVGALTLVDAAQSVPHMPVDVRELDCDFLAFSGHKLLGPTWVGVLYGKMEILEAMEPFMGGREMILTVSMEATTWNEVPHKFKAGTPNIAQVIGLGAALDYLSALGMEQVHRYGQELLAYALDALGQVTGITFYGRAPQREPVISFNLDGVHPHDLAQVADTILYGDPCPAVKIYHRQKNRDPRTKLQGHPDKVTG
jgi:cysteine desulfurase/selenocysteine lyase